jgi:hypothetical protein
MTLARSGVPRPSNSGYSGIAAIRGRLTNGRSYAPDDGAQVTVTVPGREVDASSAVEALRAALKRARAEVTRSRNDAA